MASDQDRVARHLDTAGMPQWERMQYKAFRTWVNYKLSARQLRGIVLLEDAFEDGWNLKELLEILTGKLVVKPGPGAGLTREPRFRVQKINNNMLSFTFMKTEGIRLENLQAEDVVDKNRKLILGLIWTLILHYQIQTAAAALQNSGVPTSPAAKPDTRLKDMLLRLVAQRLADYPTVQVTNFDTSWQNGMAFCALVHQHKPALIPFSTLQPQNALQNLDRAFAAIESLGVPRMLESVDLLGGKPDDKAVMAYVSLVLPVLVPANQPSSTLAPILQFVQARPSSPAKPTSPRPSSPRAVRDIDGKPPPPPSFRQEVPPPARPSDVSAPPPVPPRTPNSYAEGRGLREAAVGMPAYFHVVAQDEGNGVPPPTAFSVTVANANVSQCKARGSIYPFMYVPQQAGVACIGINYLGDIALVNTPFCAAVSDSPQHFFDTSLAHCKARGRALVRIAQNTSATFFVEARDNSGQLVSHTQDEFVVEVTDPGTGEKLPSRVVPSADNGVFLATYEPGNALRRLSVAVLFNEAHVTGSPFSPTVVRADEYATARSSELRVEPFSASEYIPGTTVRISIHAKTTSHTPAARGGDLFALNIIAPQGTTTATLLTDDNTGVYRAQPLVLQTGTYRIEATLDGAPLAGSPMRLRAAGIFEDEDVPPRPLSAQASPRSPRTTTPAPAVAPPTPRTLAAQTQVEALDTLLLDLASKQRNKKGSQVHKPPPKGKDELDKLFETLVQSAPEPPNTPLPEAPKTDPLQDLDTVLGFLESRTAAARAVTVQQPPHSTDAEQVRKELWIIRVETTWEEPRFTVVLKSEPTAEEVRLAVLSLQRLASGAASPRSSVAWDSSSAQSATASLAFATNALTAALSDNNATDFAAVFAALLELLRAVHTSALLLNNVPTTQRTFENARVVTSCVVRYLTLQHTIRTSPSPSANADAARVKALQAVSRAVDEMLELLAGGIAAADMQLQEQQEEQRRREMQLRKEQERAREDEKRRDDALAREEEELRQLEEMTRLEERQIAEARQAELAMNEQQVAAQREAEAKMKRASTDLRKRLSEAKKVYEEETRLLVEQQKRDEEAEQARRREEELLRQMEELAAEQDRRDEQAKSQRRREEEIASVEAAALAAAEAAAEAEREVASEARKKQAEALRQRISQAKRAAEAEEAAVVEQQRREQVAAQRSREQEEAAAEAKRRAEQAASRLGVSVTTNSSGSTIARDSMSVFLSSSQELLSSLPSTRAVFLSYNWEPLNQQFSAIAALIRDLWPRLNEAERSRLKACAGEALGSGKPLLLSAQRTEWIQYEAQRPLFVRHLGALRRLIVELQNPAPSSVAPPPSVTNTTVTISMSNPQPRSVEVLSVTERIDPIWLNTLTADEVRALHRRIEGQLRALIVQVDPAQRTTLQRVLSSIEGADQALYAVLTVGPAHRVSPEMRAYFECMRAQLPSLNDTAAGARRAAIRSSGLCASCQLALSGECAAVGSATFHRNCLRCSVCMTPILAGYYIGRGTQVHCPNHPPP